MMRLALIITSLAFWHTWLPAQEDIYINEFLASNVSVDADIVDFDDYSDWLELYNDGDTGVDLGGYYLTDDPDRPDRWRIPENTLIPAKGFLRLWADGYDDAPGNTYWRPWPNYLDMSRPKIYFTTDYYHLNFSLSRAGEFIGLYDPDGMVVDSITFGLQLRDVSMGRQPDGGSDWFFFGEPTPGSSNITEGVTDFTISDSPGITPESGFYSGTQTADISSNLPEEWIRYTRDGTRPGSTSLSGSLPLDISGTTVLRARIMEPGKLPGNIINRTYFIDEDISLPVISVITPPEALWDSRKGIYENRMKSREIPVRLQYFPEKGEPSIDIRAGLRLTGQLSLYCPQVSFTITARGRYGTDEIGYRIFPQREINAFKSIYLRNAGVPDHWITHFRDAMAHTLVLNKMDIDCQAFQPAVLFLNGKYWGIYNIREKISEDYIGLLHHLNPDDIDLLEYASGSITPEVMEGNAGNYTAFYQFFEDHDLSIGENYRYIESWMDMDEYINYQICEIYFDNTLWPNMNVRMWRERKEGAKWRWILFDIDSGLGMSGPGSSGYDRNTLAYATSSGNVPDPAPEWSTLIFRRLLQNGEFRNRFIQRFAGYLNAVFHPDTVLSVINELQNRLGPEMRRHIDRWKNEGFEFGVPIPNEDAWIGNVDVMKDFARNRPAYQRQHIIDHFGLTGSTVLKVNIHDPGSGKVVINEVVPIDSSASGIYFRGIPADLKAIPEVGFRFVRWEGIPEDSTEYVSIIPDADTITITAVFDTETVRTVPEDIDRDTILFREQSPYYATGNVIVPPHRTLTIESGVELFMPEQASIMVYGRLIVNGTADEPVTIAPNDHAKHWGSLCFVNATDSSVITDLRISGATKGMDFDRDRAAISGYHSDFSLSNVSVEDSGMPLFVQYGNVFVEGCRFRLTRSGDLINIKYADQATVENCDLRGSDCFDSDAIDFDEISKGIIRGNRIYNFYGFNSDGIDLGGQGILVEGNRIYNICDKGVSIGGGSTGILRRNLFANCGQGVGIKDSGSCGIIEHNTFYSSGYGIACFVKSTGRGGGTADVVNCIISDSRIASAWADDLSSVNVSYSLINTDEPGGMHNIYDHPCFTNDLYLAANSPAINSGNPTLPVDPDGSLPDMGAYPFDPEKGANLIINEIHYHPAEGTSHAFIELINSGTTPVLLRDFSISGDVQFSFPGDVVSPDEIILVAKDKSHYVGYGTTVYEWDEGDLVKGPGSICLKDDTGEMIDFVDYDSRFWWPREPDGSGPSLELHDEGLENMVSCNWRSSYMDGGTPGRKAGAEPLSGIMINEFMASNNLVHEDEHGDYDDWIELYNTTDRPLNIAGLYITDNLTDPFKYHIPLHNLQSTAIPAKGFLLLWADGEPDEGALHLGFKLDQAGEEIGLVQRCGDSARFIDSLSYAFQITDISYGRYPDGADLHPLSQPTPLASNVFTWDIPYAAIPDGIMLFRNHPNPFHTATTISYRLTDISHIELNMYDVLGRRVSTLVSGTRPAGIHRVTWEPTGLDPGIYFCELRTANGRRVIRIIFTRK